MCPRVASALFCLCVVLLLAGCGEESGLDVAEGQYRLYVEGHLTDTLSGPATVRPRRNGRVGLELGTREGPGLSIELTPPSQPDRSADPSRTQVAPGRYDVVAAPLLERPPADSLAGLLAFLSVDDAKFAATEGHFVVTHVGAETVEGRLHLEMTEQGNEALGGRTVWVTGALRAKAPRAIAY